MCRYLQFCKNSWKKAFYRETRVEDFCNSMADWSSALGAGDRGGRMVWGLLPRIYLSYFYGDKKSENILKVKPRNMQ